MNFQMFKLDLEKPEEPQIKLPTSTGSWKTQGSSRKTSALLTVPKPLTVWTTTDWKILKEMRVPDHLTCLLRNLYVGQEASARPTVDLLGQNGCLGPRPVSDLAGHPATVSVCADVPPSYSHYYSNPSYHTLSQCSPNPPPTKKVSARGGRARWVPGGCSSRPLESSSSACSCPTPRPLPGSRQSALCQPPGL